MADELIPLRESEPIFDAGGRGTRRFNRYIDDLTRTVNTTTNTTEEINTQLSQNQQTISQLAGLLKKQEVVVVTDVNYTAKPFEIVVCTNSSSIDITLEQNPIKGDIINIKRTDAEVQVLGNIDGVTDKIINVQYYSMKLIYNGTEWSEI